MNAERQNAIDPNALWCAAMRRGDFARAWAISDAVLAARDPATRDDPARPYHERWVWDGRALDGQDVLVRCYHGLGDSLQFARYLPALGAVAGRLTVEAPAALLPLLRTIPGPHRCVPFRAAAPLPSACDIEIMELAHALRLTPDGAAKPPYLGVPGDRPAELRARGPRGRPLVAVRWRAGGWDDSRSVPAAQIAAALAEAGADFIDLQGEPNREEPGDGPILPFVATGDENRGMLHTAALILAADVVVTVDTMIAHLAGALDRPTWLLAKADADWRWMADRADSPWYPNMRIYRQAAPGDWSVPLARIAADLRTLPHGR